MSHHHTHGPIDNHQQGLLSRRYKRRVDALGRSGTLTRAVTPPAPPRPLPRTTAALPLPYIFNLVGGGLNRDKLLGDFSTVQVRVGPWEYANSGDRILLHWGNLWTREFPATTDPGGTILNLAGIDIVGEPETDHDHYSGEGTHAVWYEVIPEGGGSGVSDSVEVIVKTARPGGEDPHPETPINDNLEPPAADPNPVDEAATQCTFTVPAWKNLADGDSLRFIVGGAVFAAPPGTRAVTLSKAELAKVAGKATPVTYEIIDSVGNRSKFAPYLLLDIWSEESGLLERIELVDDHGEFIDGAIDPLASGIRARVPRYGDKWRGDSVTVHLNGTDRYGQNVDLADLGPTEWKSSDYYLDFPMPPDLLQSIAGGVLRVHYTGAPNGGHSYRRLYVVDMLPETKLPAPVLLGESGGELPIGTDPDKEIDILIPVSERLVEFSRITLTMTGVGASGPVFKTDVHNVGEGEGHQPYTFRWKAEELKALVDHEATFSYTIRTLDAQGSLLGIYESEEHAVVIREARGPGDRLPPPIVHGLVDGNLPPTTNPLRLTIPAGHEKPARSKVTTTVSGLTTMSHTDVLFEDDEALTVDFEGWPAINDGAKATAWYHFENDQASREASFTVGEARKLPLPTVDQAVGGQVLAIALADGMTMRIPGDADIDPGDTLQFVMEGNGAEGSYVSGPLPGTTRSHTIPAKHFGWNFSTSILVFYRLTHAGRTTDSPKLTLVVVPFSNGDTQLPRPSIDKASGSELDVPSLREDPNVLLAPWPLIDGGQRVWIEISGTMKDGTPATLTVADGELVAPGAVNDGVSYRVTRNWLEGLRDGSEITAAAGVTFDGVAQNPILFPVKSYRIKGLSDFVLDPSGMTLNVGNTRTRTPQGGVPPYSYRSDSVGVATVDSNGTVTANGSGVATITVSDSAPQANSGKYTVTVAQAFALVPSKMYLEVGRTDARTPTGGTPPYSYSSSRPTVADVDRSGTVTGIRLGATTITVHDSASPVNSATYPVAVTWLEDFNREEPVRWILDKPMTLHSGIVAIVTEGTAAIIHNMDDNKILRISHGVVRMRLPTSASVVSFTCSYVTQTGYRASLYDSTGQLLVDKEIPKDESGRWILYELNAPQGKMASMLVLSTKSWIAQSANFDNVRWSTP